MMQKTKCDKCGCESDKMGVGNACHNENCTGIHGEI